MGHSFHHLYSFLPEDWPQDSFLHFFQLFVQESDLLFPVIPLFGSLDCLSSKINKFVNFKLFFLISSASHQSFLHSFCIIFTSLLIDILFSAEEESQKRVRTASEERLSAKEESSLNLVQYFLFWLLFTFSWRRRRRRRSRSPSLLLKKEASPSSHCILSLKPFTLHSFLTLVFTGWEIACHERKRDVSFPVFSFSSSSSSCGEKRVKILGMMQLFLTQRLVLFLPKLFPTAPVSRCFSLLLYIKVENMHHAV